MARLDLHLSARQSRVSPSKPEVLPRAALALTTPETGVFYGTLLEPKGFENLPPGMLEKVPMIPLLESALKEQNATLKDLGAIFGNELSVVLQNGKGGKFDGTVAVPLRDAPRAQKLAEALTSPSRGTEAWTADRTNGSPVYAPSDAASPVFALTDRFWLLSWGAPSLTSFLQRPPSTPQLDAAPSFKAAAATVSEPNSAFGYIDLGALFEAGYVWARPFLALTLAGNAETSDYIDAGKLPSGGVIGRHLGSIVISQSTRPDGQLLESRGNLSTAQVVLGGGGALVNFAMNSPLLKQFAPALPSMLNFPQGRRRSAEPPVNLSTDPALRPDGLSFHQPRHSPARLQPFRSRAPPRPRPTGLGEAGRASRSRTAFRSVALATQSGESFCC